MSSADPFLPVGAQHGEPDADVLPADDRLELDRVGEDVGTDGAETDEVARPARFVTPAPGDALDAEGLRRDLGLG
jgi:hypothetical protein